MLRRSPGTSTMRIVLVATCLSLAAGFRGVPRAPLVRAGAAALPGGDPVKRSALRTPLMAASLSKLPLPSLIQVCYGALLFTSGQGLMSDALMGSFDRPVVLDVFIFFVSAFSLRQTLAKVDYSVQTSKAKAPCSTRILGH